METAQVCRETGTMLLVDECFGWFLENRRQYSLLPAVTANPEAFRHVVLLDSLTKICGIPGLRPGYLISSSKQLLERISEYSQPWPVNLPAEEAACAAFARVLAEELPKVRRLLALEKPVLEQALEGLGMEVFPSDANFLLFRSPRNGTDLKKELLSRGILIRSCGEEEGLATGYYRACVRSADENRELIDALRQICRENQHG